MNKNPMCSYRNGKDHRHLEKKVLVPLAAAGLYVCSSWKRMCSWRLRAEPMRGYTTSTRFWTCFVAADPWPLILGCWLLQSKLMGMFRTWASFYGYHMYVKKTRVVALSYKNKEATPMHVHACSSALSYKSCPEKRILNADEHLSHRIWDRIATFESLETSVTTSFS